MERLVKSDESRYKKDGGVMALKSEFSVGSLRFLAAPKPTRLEVNKFCNIAVNTLCIKKLDREIVVKFFKDVF